MTCKDLSEELVIFVISAVALLTIFIAMFTAIRYISWLTSEPIECIDSKVYEVTYEGNIKILDEQHGGICTEVRKDMK
jgi:hypothetical protein